MTGMNVKNSDIPTGLRRAVFFDRDGVLNVDKGYVHKTEDFVWLDTAVEAIRLLNQHGVLVFVVTNQAGVARGFYGEDDVRRLHAHIQSELARNGARIDDFRYCPHHPDAVIEAYRSDCAWRKPRDGMIRDLLRQWRVDPGASRLFGDKSSDVEAGMSAGVRSMLVDGTRPLIDLIREYLGDAS